ncbi:ABC transporter substrate-binding protein [Janthinobacterium agaricidamnosum]|uniref:Bacterial extracellular solute-binding s, 3 family protein n=1 Tax=Janthinobacterium agaricidamnosum NBRC 102515 = DSM 9628 TaxID=1349767 RepID=W0V9N4_9BURK|nr:ABC transporter substrate-binding protein [Janthinobacterium agaricidamnosum]CDG84325.1 bacterial extracellular solute-binding s, 3 family protein [Janthinobacterium agaricidamnosum NBRC 102515 = DSM 9628]
MHLRFTFVAALIAGAVIAPLCHADQLAAIKAKGELVCGTLGTDEPNSFVDPKTRQIVGYEVDLCYAVAKTLGVKPVIKQLAVAARIPELQQGRVDILSASLTHNKEREALVDFSISTFVTGQKVLVKKSSNITSLAGLTGKKVLTVKGGTQEPNIRKAVPGVDVVTFETAVQGFLALQQGKGVAYVDDEVSLLNNYGKLGAAQKEYLVLPQSIGVEALALGIKKGETGLKASIDGTLRALEQSGDAEKLFFKWYGPSSNVKYDKRNFKLDSDRAGA